MEDLRNTLNESSAFYQKQKQLITARLAILPRGSIKAKKIGRDTFFYLQYRKGKTIKSDYVGKQVPASLREELAERKRLEKELLRVREALKLLRVKNNDETDLTEPLRLILRKMTEEKLWEAGLEIIGSWCFLLYQKLLPLEKYPLKTQDLDILIPIPYRGRSFDFGVFLKQLGFSENFNLDGSVYFTGNMIKVEFLGPERGNGLKPTPHIKEIAVTPQLLRYLGILFEEPLMLKIARGLKVKAPAPAAFALHKLIVATDPRRAGKSEKDIRQAVYTGKYVLSNKSETGKMVRLWKRLPQPWKRKAHKALERAMEIVPIEQNAIRHLKTKLA